VITLLVAEQQIKMEEEGKEEGNKDYYESQ